MTTNDRTMRLHRVLPTKPDRIYRAFLDADALARWLPPNRITGKVQELDARPGGRPGVSFTIFTTGNSQPFGGEYVKRIPNQRLRYTDRFDDLSLPGGIRVTMKLKAVSYGTDLTIAQEAIPEMIPLDACYLGWQESLRNLTCLVKPNITDRTIAQNDSKGTYELDVTKPMEAYNVFDFTLAPQGVGTNVTRVMRGPMPCVSKGITSCFHMDKGVGGGYEKGLTALKLLAQKQLPGALPRQQPAQGESTCV